MKILRPLVVLALAVAGLLVGHTIVYAWGSAEPNNRLLAVQVIDGIGSNPQGVPAGNGGQVESSWRFGLVGLSALLAAGAVLGLRRPRAVRIDRSPVRSWLTAGAAALVTGSVVGIVTVPATSIAGTGPMPAAVLKLPASHDPSPTKRATPVSERGSPGPVAERSPLGDPVRQLTATGLTIPVLGIDQQVAGVGVRPDGSEGKPGLL